MATRPIQRAAMVSLLVAVAILAIKVGAWLATGSATILSDALESVVHVGATLVVAWCARMASAPPDEDHPYGHGRAEFLSAGFEGGAIAVASIGVAGAAVHALLSEASPQRLDLGLILIAFASLINAGLGWWLLRRGRHLGSPLLIADGQHVLSDVWTSLGVLAGVLTLRFIDHDDTRRIVDALIALILAGYLLFVAWRLVRSAIAGLMDEADPRLIDAIIGHLQRLRQPGWIDVHGLRVRRSGRAIHADLHLVVPRAWTVAEAHTIAERLERDLLAALDLPGSIMVHLDHDGDAPYRDLPKDGLPITRERATRQEEPTPSPPVPG